jgi:hypothetical protein
MAPLLWIQRVDVVLVPFPFAEKEKFRSLDPAFL